MEATKLGAYDFIEKPPDRERLLLVARNALSRRKLTEENRRLKLSFDERYRMEGVLGAEVELHRYDVSPTRIATMTPGEGDRLPSRTIRRTMLPREEVNGDLWVISYLSRDGRTALRDGAQGMRVAQDLSGAVTLEGSATNTPGTVSGQLESEFVLNFLLETRPGTQVIKRTLAMEIVPRHWTWQ